MNSTILKSRAKETVENKIGSSFKPGYIVEFIAAGIVVILLLEMIFSISGVGEQECLRIDKELGFAPFENKDITWRKEGFSRTRFNSWGMQDREYPVDKPPGTKRIAIAGDSYIEALQVDRKDNFCSLIEKALNDGKSKSENFEVMNFGVQAHNLAQTYLNLKKTVYQFKPDIVILPYRPNGTYLLPPDIKSGFLSARPNFFVNKDGSLIEDRTVQNLWLKSSSARRMRATEWLRKNSRIWGAIAIGAEAFCSWWNSGGLLKNFTSTTSHQLPAFQTNIAPKESLEIHGESDWVETSKFGEESIKSVWPVANALITEINRDCTENGAKLILVRLPGVNGLVSRLETNLLKQTASENNIPLCDLTEAFHKHLKLKEKLFFDTHFTKEGHRLTADGILNFLKLNSIEKNIQQAID